MNYMDIIYDNFEPVYGFYGELHELFNNKKESKQKQNKTLDNEIVTPNKLDAEAEDILGSLENDVMKILKKTKYFDKVLEE